MAVARSTAPTIGARSMVLAVVVRAEAATETGFHPLAAPAATLDAAMAAALVDGLAAARLAAPLVAA